MPELVLHARAALLPTGWGENVRLAVSNGVITSIELGVPRRPEDEAHGAILPGLPNVHSHAFQRGMAGLAERRGPSADSFWTWREAMYRFVDRIGPEELLAITSLAYLEMLEAGFTRVGEFHYLHHDPAGAPYAERAEMAGALVAAAVETGIGLTLLPVFYAHAGFGGAALTHAQRRFACDLDGFAQLLEGAGAAARVLPDAVVGLAPHSLRAVTPAELTVLLPLTHGPIHIHVAEQVREVEECLTWSAARPVEWLLDRAPVDARWCLVHATHMSDAETAQLAASGAVAGLCPITEANLGDGLFPAEAFLAAGGRIAVGSDSNVRIDAAEELRLLEYGQRLDLRRRNVLARRDTPSTGEHLYRHVLRGGGQALGVEAAIRVAAPADLVSLDLDHPAFAARGPDRLIDAWIFAGGGVDCVWRRGQRVVTNGRHRGREPVLRRYRAALERLLA